MLAVNRRQPSLILPIMPLDPFPEAAQVLRSLGEIIPERVNKLLEDGPRKGKEPPFD